jgi:hypothetical protein
VPTILRFRGFRIMIYTEDHGPAHVHAVKGNKYAVFLLRCPSGPITLRENAGLRKRETAALRRFLSDNLGLLCAAWEKIHGTK